MYSICCTWSKIINILNTQNKMLLKKLLIFPTHVFDLVGFFPIFIILAGIGQPFMKSLHKIIKYFPEMHISVSWSTEISRNGKFHINPIFLPFPVWPEETTAGHLNTKTGYLSENMIQIRIQQANLGEGSVIVQWMKCYVDNKNLYLGSFKYPLT